MKNAKLHLPPYFDNILISSLQLRCILLSETVNEPDVCLNVTLLILPQTEGSKKKKKIAECCAEAQPFTRPDDSGRQGCSVTALDLSVHPGLSDTIREVLSTDGD